MPKLVDDRLKKTFAVDVKFSTPDRPRIEKLAKKMRTNKTDAVRRAALDRCDQEGIK